MELKMAGFDAAKMAGAKIQTHNLPEVLLRQATDYRARAHVLWRVQEGDSSLVGGLKAGESVDPKTGLTVKRMTNHEAANWLEGQANVLEGHAKTLFNFNGTAAEEAAARRAALDAVNLRPAGFSDMREVTGGATPYKTITEFKPKAEPGDKVLGTAEGGVLVERPNPSFNLDTYRHSQGVLTQGGLPAGSQDVKAVEDARVNATIDNLDAIEKAQPRQLAYRAQKADAFALSDRAATLLRFADGELPKAERAPKAKAEPKAEGKASGNPVPVTPESGADAKPTRTRSRAGSKTQTQVERASGYNQGKGYKVKTRKGKAEPAQDATPKRTRSGASTRTRKPADPQPTRARGRSSQSSAMDSPSNQRILNQLMMLSDVAGQDFRDIPIVPRTEVPAAPVQPTGIRGFLSKIPLIGKLFGG